MGTLEEIDARIRANERAANNFADIGAVWHSVSCACPPCMDADARFICLGAAPLRRVAVPLFADTLAAA